VRRFRSLVCTALLIAPMTAFGRHLPFTALPAVIPVAMPEYWGAPDSLVFFVVVLGIFALLVRSKVLPLSSKNEK
jgi:hypothetical protein